jgi:hypothetical protein
MRSADVSRMRIRVFSAVFVLALAACGGGGGDDPAAPSTDDAGTGPLQVLERAQDVADQLDSREADMEQMVEDLGG